jgi:hypothetical protein
MDLYWTILTSDSHTEIYEKLDDHIYIYIYTYNYTNNLEV